MRHPDEAGRARGSPWDKVRRDVRLFSGRRLTRPPARRSAPVAPLAHEPQAARGATGTRLARSPLMRSSTQRANPSSRRRLRPFLALVVAGALVAVIAGCGGS